MKRLLLFIYIGLSASCLLAQREWIKLGVNVSNINSSSDTIIGDTDAKLGYHLGATLYIPLKDKIDFETGLFYSTKGFSRNILGDLSAVNGTIVTTSPLKTNLGYIDFPLALRFHSAPVDERLFFANIGVYSSILLFAVERQTYTQSGNERSYKESLTIGNNNSDIVRRLDFGITTGGGIEMGLFQFGIHCDFGLLNIAPDQSQGRTLTNRTLRLSVAIRN